MAAWNYKSYAIIQKNRRIAGRWLSTATFRTEKGEVILTAYPSTNEGYADENRAQQATEKFVRDHIEKIGPSEFGSNRPIAPGRHIRKPRVKRK